jgi:maltooligosyltrehalose trehalohydrolase
MRVWAPARKRVELVGDGMRYQMRRTDRGWWEADNVIAEPGMRYGYSLDGGDVRPDPRSPSQPEGVFGPSEVVDHDAYRWHDGGWRGLPLAGSVIYELHAGTFSSKGTFDGVIEHLPYLVELGVDAIEVMPVAEFAGERGWGYDGVDLFAPHHAYGGPAALKRLVDACHSAGLGAVLDVVYNHLGPAGNFLAEFGPYFSDRHRTEWGSALNFDGAGSDEVRRFILDNALMWIRDYHFDGLRLDAVHAIVDQTPVNILEQLAVEAEALGEEVRRTVFLVAESDLNEPRLVRSREAGGYGLEAAWSDDWHHSLHAALTGEQTGYYRDFGPLAHLGKALRQAWVYDGVWSDHRQRTRGRKASGIASHSFVVAIQNHDQVGNRATGERLGAVVDRGSLEIAAALLLTSPFTPMLFHGEEWAAGTPFQYFTDFSDLNLGRAVREGRGQEFAAFGWNPHEVPDPQDPATFERSRLDWSELSHPAHRSMLQWYRELIRLRRRLPAPRDPAGEGVIVEIDDALRRIVFEREGVNVRVNLGHEDWSVTVPAGFKVALASERIVRSDAGLRLPPFSVAVLESDVTDG